ncbi:MAG: transcriptional repressor [Bacteroidales bacterium]|nr:transcriptional repressor [Bacteroidales bacterium]MBD5245218.1 transcriptional repressor [Barnesiella sp.]
MIMGKVNNISVLSDKLKKYLLEKSLRQTPERMALLEVVTKLKRRFTVDDLDALFSESNFKLSRATLYNNIHLFENAGILRRHKISSQKACYEVVYSDEPLSCYQEICTICGKIRDFTDAEIAQHILARKSRFFRPEYFSVQIHGICYGCLRKMKKEKQKNINQ